MGPPADGPQVRQGDNVAPRCHLTQVRTAVVLGFVVFLACLAGIFSRLPGTLAVIWPANALLLGLLLRNRSSATVCAWLSTAIAYVTADLLTGSQLHVAVLLNAANLLGVLVGFYTVRRIRPDGGVGLDNGANAAWITCLAALSAASGATIGAVAVHTMFDEPLGHAWLGWFAVEFINYAVILPIVLCWPTRSIRAQMAPFHTRNLLVPTALMLVALPLAWFMAGVGSMAFTTPALIAAALSTDVFVTSLFVAAATVWSVVLIVSNGVALTTDAGTPINPSALIGLALLAAGPLATASAMAERRRIDQALRRAMTQDDLTKAYRRGEFVRRARADGSGRIGRPVQRVVVHHHRHAIAAQMQVELDDVDAKPLNYLKRLFGVKTRRDAHGASLEERYHGPHKWTVVIEWPRNQHYAAILNLKKGRVQVMSAWAF